MMDKIMISKLEKEFIFLNFILENPVFSFYSVKCVFPAKTFSLWHIEKID
jgi:hypothetical protein